MDENDRQGTRQLGHLHQKVTHSGPSHQQTQPGPPVNTPSLDQFLSGITTERNHRRSNVGPVSSQMIPPPKSHNIRQGPPPPRLPQPGSSWQTPPSGFMGNQQQQDFTGPKQWQDHQSNPNFAKRFDKRDTSFSKRTAASFSNVLETSESQRTMLKTPAPVDGSLDCHSFSQEYHQEQHISSSFSNEKPPPFAPPQTNLHPLHPSGSGTPQPQTYFQGYPFPGTHPPDKCFSPQQQHNERDFSYRGPNPSGPHPSGPHPSGPHPSGPHPSGQHLPGPHLFGHPGQFNVPPPSQPSHPHQEHREQNQLGHNFPGQDPRVPHPTEPHSEVTPHPGTRPGHPSNFIPSGLPPPMQQQGGVPDPFPLSEPNRLGLPPPHPKQQLEFTSPVPQPPQGTATVREKSQREKDEDWLKDWLRKNKIGQSEKMKEKKIKSLSIYEGRRLVADLLQALRQLNEQKDMLIRHINRDESSWQYECRRVNRTKERVEGLQARLFSREVVDQLQSKMKKIRKKRARLKRQRLENYQRQQEEEERRKELHLKIDAKLAKRLQAEQEKKREAELQEEVDKTLYEVRKKKQEVAQALDLIKGLRKLRQLRKDAAQAKGVHTSRESDISFDLKLKPLEELMSKQSVLYREEERVMQVMLEEEHEEYKEQEKERQRKRQEEKTLKETRAKMKLLFGKEDLVGPDNPLFPFQQFYHQAESNVHALVEIRHQWDQFLVPDTDPEGSAIPVSWVLPSEPSNPAWASILDT